MKETKKPKTESQELFFFFPVSKLSVNLAFKDKC